MDYVGTSGANPTAAEPRGPGLDGRTPDTLSASWTAYDPESVITLYRYAIGTTPGGEDVLNWLDTSDTQLPAGWLSLLDGQTYYIAVKARNEGGLWSEAGISSGVVAGSGTCPVVDFGTRMS